MAQEHELLLPLVQEENICLPLPIKAVSKYWDVDLPAGPALERAKRYADFEGNILIEGIELAERRGLACRVVCSGMRDLKDIISAGIPPIVILPGIPEITQHASVITGYSDKEDTILHYVQKGDVEGQVQEGAIPQGTFEREWSEDGRQAILVAPPDVMGTLALENSAGEEAGRLGLEYERHMILREYERAAGALKRAAGLDPNNPVILYMQGSMLSMQNSERCVEFYERCLGINDRFYLACNGLGNHYLKSDCMEKAESAYARAIGINPKRSAKIYKNRAYVLEKMGRNREARSDLQTYIRLLPRAPDRRAIEKAIREL